MNLDYSLLTIMRQFVMDESLTRMSDAFSRSTDGNFSPTPYQCGNIVKGDW